MMSVPNENFSDSLGSASGVYTGVAPAGTPPPASQAGNYVQKFDVWDSTTVQGDTPDLGGDIPPLSGVASQQYSAEYCLPADIPSPNAGQLNYITSNLYRDVPSPGLAPSPAPISREVVGGPSTGQQVGDVAFSTSQWNVP